MMHFKFSPNILNRLGEELIPNPDQGIIELIKNSYDADATECTVELVNTNAIGGYIIISDNGIGMDISAINEGWLVLGRSKKASREPTTLGRLPVGDKGLGRLAALKQGSQVILKTRPKYEPGFEYSLTINWDAFESADVVEDVTFDVQKNSTDKTQGTDIKITNLKSTFSRRDIKRLARELLLLADPFDNCVAFRLQLITPEFSDIEKQVNDAYFENAEYHLKAYVNAGGIAEADLLDWKGDVLFHAEHNELSQGNYKTTSAEFELWVFLLNPQNFSAKNTSVSVKEVRDWLSEVGNVHLYHRGLRVKPYGDQGDDWLKLNYARARNPEVRPSTSTVIGRVIVNDPNDRLIQKSHHSHRPGLTQAHPAIFLPVLLLHHFLALHIDRLTRLLLQGLVMICGLLCHWLLMVGFQAPLTSLVPCTPATFLLSTIKCLPCQTILLLLPHILPTACGLAYLLLPVLLHCLPVLIVAVCSLSPLTLPGTLLSLPGHLHGL
jgi:hypothetical protein